MLETLSQVGELAGGIGSLFALLYLGIQIRQNHVTATAQPTRTRIDTGSTRPPTTG